MKVEVEIKDINQNLQEHQEIFERITTHINRFQKFLVRSGENKSCDFGELLDIYEAYADNMQLLAQNRIKLIEIIAEAVDENR